MSRGWYGITGTGNDMINRYREQECISQYIRSKTKIKQQIDEIQNREPRHFCRRCRALKEHIHAENNKINCYFSNSKSLKLIEDDDIKGFMAECIDYPTCFLNRTRSSKKTVVPARASAGKDKQQSGGYSKTSKHGGSPIKGSPGQDKNSARGNVLTEEKKIPHKPDGISASHNSGEAQEEASKQITNLPASTSGRRDTQEQTLSQSVHPQVSETDSHANGSIKGTPNGEGDLLKPTKLIDLRISTSESGSPGSQIAEDHGVKNQDRDRSAAVTEIPDTGAHDIKGVDTDACSKIIDGKKTCDEKAVARDSSPVTSYDSSTDLDTTLEEYVCSEEDFDELFVSQLHRGEARDREIHSSEESGNLALGVVSNTSVLNPSTEKGTNPAYLTQDHIIHDPEEVSDINTCQTSDTVSTPRCVPSKRAEESVFSSHKGTRSEQPENQDQISVGQDSHQRNQLNKQESARQMRQLQYEQESSLEEQDRSAGKHYRIEDIVQHLHLQKNYRFRKSIYFSRRERSIYTYKFIYI
ncbi:VIR protein [Plasmodium vivax]|uniref:VIR protein n=1 Tax=Plasmodium vivax TaxID=5855 RepID=A0A1G4E841_PLAVI|nr:VIR protein [Plasmodium vivax]